MIINKNLNATKGVEMIEKMLALHKDKLPSGKTINDFGGGYVEFLKTKAKVVLYFGFDSSKNRVSFSFQIRKDDVVLWSEAIAEKIWNTELVSDEVVCFGSEPIIPQTEQEAKPLCSAVDKEEEFVWN